MTKPTFSYAETSTPGVKRNVIRLIETATGQRRLRRLYLAHHDADGATRESFWQAAVRSLGLDVRFDRAALNAIPKQGPVVVVANHPYGVLDGIVMSWLMEQARPDFLVLTHSALLQVPEVQTNLLPVDFAETPEALATNLRTRAKAKEHLDKGGCIVVFPAGGISTVPDRLGRGLAYDAPWQPFVAQLIQRAKATVVPIYFDGQNSRLFHIASHISLTLRLSLIFHEVKNKMGTALAVTIGKPIPFEAISGFPDRKAVADRLMTLTYGLAGRTVPAITARPSPVVRAREAVALKFERLQTKVRKHIPKKTRRAA